MTDPEAPQRTESRALGGVRGGASARPGAARAKAALALGAALAPRGVMVKLALGLCAATVLGAIVATVSLADRGPAAPLAELASLTASALAWGGGVLVAFAAAARALRQDRSDGVRALLRMRGASPTSYACGRVAGLALVVALPVAGGALITGLVTLLVAAHAGGAGRAALGVLASIAYGLGFAIVVAPLAFAALGARSRGGGYVGLLALLIGPELALPWTRRLVPPAWQATLSIPNALDALRAALMPPHVDPLALARASLALALFTALCFLVVRIEIARIDAPPSEERA